MAVTPILWDFIPALDIPPNSFVFTPTGNPSMAGYGLIHQSGIQHPAFLIHDDILHISIMSALCQRLDNMASASNPVTQLLQAEYNTFRMRLEDPHRFSDETTTSSFFNQLILIISAATHAL